MKRLTEYTIPETGFSVVSEEKYKRILMEEKPSVEKVYNRLKKIEDILGDEYDLDRLRELLEVNREGRCVVLPCKVGDTLYDIYEAMGNGTGEIRELKVNDIRIHLDKRSKEWLIAGGYYFSLSDFGKTVFLTREEAEAALATDC